MFLSNLNSFNSSPSPPDQGFAKRKGSSKVWKEKGSKCFSLVLCITLCNLFLFVFFSVLVYFVFHIKIKKKKIQKQCVCLCTLVLVYLGWPLKRSFLNFISFVV